MSLIHFPLRVSDDAEIVEADGSVLGHVVWHDNSPNGQWKENADERAAEIVHRCNAHDELVASLRNNIRRCVPCHGKGVTRVGHNQFGQPIFPVPEHACASCKGNRDLLAKVEAR